MAKRGSAFETNWRARRSGATSAAFWKHGKDLTEANKDDGSSQRPPDQMDEETKELMKHMKHVKRMTEPNKDGGFSQRPPDKEDMGILKQMQKELDGAQAALVTMATGLNITNEELGD